MQGILVIEDRVEDYTAVSRALDTMGIRTPITWCSDGQEGLDCIHHLGKFSHVTELPQLVLLDIHLSGMIDGIEVLRQIKTDENYRKIPVVVFTTSSNPRDIQDCQQNGSDGYIVKPVDFKEYIKALQAVRKYLTVEKGQ